MLKIIQNYVKVAAIGKQNAVICEITDAWLFNYKKNVINKNIEKIGPSQYRALRNSAKILAQSLYAELIFVLCSR